MFVCQKDCHPKNPVCAVRTAHNSQFTLPKKWSYLKIVQDFDEKCNDDKALEVIIAGAEQSKHD